MTGPVNDIPYRRHLPLERFSTLAQEADRTVSTQLEAKTILIVDDDRQLSEWLRSALVERGANVSIASDSADGLSMFLGLRPDLVLIERRLAIRSGMDLLREIRLLTDVPVVMLDAMAGNADIARYLDAGADDFVAKPFEVRILMARIRALLRRVRWQRGRHIGNAYEDGRLTIDLSAFQVTADGTKVKLSATEFALLTHLVRRAGRTCTYTEILADVWGEPFTNHMEYVHAYIWQLRRKLEQNPKKPAYLKSVRGKGYRFVADDSAASLKQR
jgi:DNA-binding response OmpR family regulator